MNRSLARFILKLIGWRVEGSLPESLKKVIVIMAPHTSNWDFVLGFIGFSALGLKSKYLIKEEMFIFPIGYIIRKVGGISVNRAHNSIVLQVGELFRNSEELIITVTPEATRSLNLNWKKGFYFIAQNANIPIVFGYLDYKTKSGGLGPIFNITGDFNKDLTVIEEFYKTKSARFPANFNLSPENLKKRKV